MKNIAQFALPISAFAMASSAASASDAGGTVELAQAAAPSAPVAQPAVQISDDVFIRNAVAVVQSLSADGAGQAYDSGSVILKRATGRDDFVMAVAAANARVGHVVTREWVRVEHLKVEAPAAGAPAPAVPQGDYVTVALLARNNGGVAHAEQVSFRLDEDNNWRLTGVTTLPLE